MPNTLHPWIARVAALMIVPALSLPGCDEQWSQVIRKRQPHTGNQGESTRRKNTCLMEYMYLVEGDTFTRMSGGWMTFGEGTSVEGGFGWNPDIEPRAKCQTNLDGYGGEASLLWNDFVVDSFEIDRMFLMSDEVAILSHEAPDGTRVEYHVYAQPRCGAFPADVSTRAQIDDLEH